MNQNQQYVLTRAGYEALEQELQEYQQRLDRHMQELADIQSDVDENYDEQAAEYDVRTRKEFLSQRIGNLKLILQDAEVIDEDPNPRTVDPGDRVTVWNASQKEQLQYDLIGSAEAQYGREGVSIDSPVGEALLGKRRGDVVEVETPDGMVRYMICGIERSPTAHRD